MKDIAKEKRMLLIVDPQIDFITGSLPVPGAEDAMNALALYLQEYGHLYGGNAIRQLSDFLNYINPDHANASGLK